MALRLPQWTLVTSFVIARGLRVLVVDGDPAIGKLVTLILQAGAHRVVAVTSADEALEHLRVDRFDVVLSDPGIGLGIDGLELCTLVRSGWPGVRFELLTKPFRLDDVRRSVAA